MSFAGTTGNEAVRERVREMIESGNVPHAFIIEAPASVDKEAFAVRFAQALLCPEKPALGCGVCPVCRRIAARGHIDVYFVQATQNKGSKVASVKDADIEALQERLAAKPLEAARSIAIIRDADSITPRAFNRFLKTLEEPAPGTVILLLSENMETMPPTIRSRCVRLRLLAEDAAQGDEARQAAFGAAGDLLAALFEESPFYRVREILEPQAKSREEALLFIDMLEERASGALAEGLPATERDRMYRLVAALEDARACVKRGDRADYALKKMALSAGGQ